MKNLFKKPLFYLSVVLILTLGFVSYDIASAQFSEPSSSFPNGNPSAPLSSSILSDGKFDFSDTDAREIMSLDAGHRIGLDGSNQKLLVTSQGLTLTNGNIILDSGSGTIGHSASGSPNIEFESEYMEFEDANTYCFGTDAGSCDDNQEGKVHIIGDLYVNNIKDRNDDSFMLNPSGDSDFKGNVDINDGNLILSKNGGWIGLSDSQDDPNLEFEGGGIELTGGGLSFGDGPPSSGIDMKDNEIRNVSQINGKDVDDLGGDSPWSESGSTVSYDGDVDIKNNNLENVGSISFPYKDRTFDGGNLNDRGRIFLRGDTDGSEGGTYTCSIDVYDDGAFWCDGAKNFVHQISPTKEAAYTSQESAGVWAVIEGTSKLDNGEAVIDLPHHFTAVTSDTEPRVKVQVTPNSADTYGLAVTDKNTENITVKELMNGSNSYEFDYRVIAVRDGYEDKEVVRDISERRQEK